MFLYTKGNFESGQNKIKACSYTLKDRKCDPLFVTMDTSCKLCIKRDNILQLRTSNSFVDYHLQCPPLSNQPSRITLARDSPILLFLLSLHRPYTAVPLRYRQQADNTTSAPVLLILRGSLSQREPRQTTPQ